MKNQTNKLDRSALRFNQAAIVVLTGAGFIFNLPLLVGFTALVMLIGTIFPGAGLFKMIYKGIVKPLNIIKPVIVEEDNSPHLFAQGLGGIFLAASFILLEFFSLSLVGWALAIIVILLAFINLTLNFCAGCFLYFQLHKLGLLNKKPAAESENA
jgi:Domain of unknown function (DUF4395)